MNKSKSHKTIQYTMFSFQKRHGELINLNTNCCSEMWPTTRRAQKSDATVDAQGTRFIVPALRDPLSAEKNVGRHRTSSNPYRVLSVWWSILQSELHCEWSQRRQFLRHAPNPLEHGCAASQHDFDMQILCGCSRHTSCYSGKNCRGLSRLSTNEILLEQTLPRNRNGRRQIDDVSVRKLVGLLLVTVRGRFELDDG